MITSDKRDTLVDVRIGNNAGDDSGIGASGGGTGGDVVFKIGITDHGDLQAPSAGKTLVVSGTLMRFPPLQIQSGDITDLVVTFVHAEAPTLTIFPEIVTGNPARWSASATLGRPGKWQITATSESRDASDYIAVDVSDTLPPVVQILAPSDGQSIVVPELGNEIEVILGVQDPLGVKRVRATLDSEISLRLVSGDDRSGTWVGRVKCSSLPLGSRTIGIWAEDFNANSTPTPAGIKIVVRDDSPPVGKIVAPRDGSRFFMAGDGSNCPIEIELQAVDLQTGIRRIECELLMADSRLVTGQSHSREYPDATSSVVWPNLILVAPGPGWYSVRARFWDWTSSRPSESLVKNIEVAGRIAPLNPNDVVGQTEYLRALLRFFQDHVKDGSGSAVTAEVLTQKFGQPFNGLAVDTSAASVSPINETRLCTEILRQILSRQPDFDGAAPTAYLLDAYSRLLRGLGTSYDELRLMQQGAPLEARRKLAMRLGLGEDVTKLGLLLLDPAESDGDRALTVSKLAQLFALGARPDSEGVVAGDVHRWQLEQIESSSVTDDASLPWLLIDPDVIANADLCEAGASSAVAQTLSDRRSMIKGREMALRDLRSTRSATYDQFKIVLDDIFNQEGGVGGNAVQLLRDFRDRASRGEPITVDLAARQLSTLACDFLLRAADLAEAGSLTEREWDDVMAIGVGIWKAKQYGLWREQESASGIALSPRNFSLYHDELPRLPNTGFRSGLAILRGGQDLTWTVSGPVGSDISGRPYVATVASRVWLPDDDASRWLSPKERGDELLPVGHYTYSTAIDLDGWDLSTIELVARVAVDDSLVLVGIAPETGPLHRIQFDERTGSCTSFTALAIDSAWLCAGLNRLSFVVQNQGNQPSSTALRVDFQFARPPRRLRASPWRLVAPSAMPRHVPGVSTGIAVDGRGRVGVVDPNWRITALPDDWPDRPSLPLPAFVVEDPPQPWLANSATGCWIGLPGSGDMPHPPGEYVFEATLDLTGWDLSVAQLQLRVAADDRATVVMLQGSQEAEVLLGAAPGYAALTTLGVPDKALKAGRNLFRVRVCNDGVSANPVGLRVEFQFVVPPVQPGLEWSINPVARAEWQDRLAIRIDQRNGFQQAVVASIQYVEEATITQLRDALIARYARLRREPVTSVAEKLGSRYLLEARGDAWRLTTPVQKAIESIQALVRALREGRVASDPEHPAAEWRLAIVEGENDTQDQFDEEWSWIGSYEAWRAAMLTFCFPENVLLPSLVPEEERSGAFTALLNALRARTRISRNGARRMAQDYLATFTNDRLLAFWPCNEGQGTKLGDHGLAKMDAEIGHAKEVSWVVADPPIGRALTLDTQTSVEIPDNEALNLAERGINFTLCLRVRISATNPSSTRELRVIQRGSLFDLKASMGLWVRRQAANTNAFEVGWVWDSSATQQAKHWSSEPLNAETWYHLALCREGNAIHVYIDGNRKSEASVELSGPLQDGRGKVKLGGSDGMPMVPWTGDISDLRIYGYALNPWMLGNLARIGFLYPTNILETVALSDVRTDAELRAFGEKRKSVWDDPRNSNEARQVLRECWYFAPLAIAQQLQKSCEYAAALDWYKSVYLYTLKKNDAQRDPERKIFPGLLDESNDAPTLNQGDHWLREELNPHIVARRRTGSNPYTRFVLISLARCLIEYADAEFARDTGESVAVARQLYLSSLDLLGRPDLDQTQPLRDEQVLLPNPVLAVLRARATNQLKKLRQGRNVAGVKRNIELPQPPASLSFANIITNNGKLISPQTKAPLVQASYRYATLMERAKQLIAIAQQAENAYLSAMEKVDQENYNQKKAAQDLRITAAGQAIQKLRVKEAESSKLVIVKQQNKAIKQRTVLQDRISNGLSDAENSIFVNYTVATVAKTTSTIIGGAITALQAYQSVAAAISPWDKIAASTLATATVVATGIKTAADVTALVADNNATVASLTASFERRKEDWQLTFKMADFDVQICDQQLTVADDHISIARQEQELSNLQNENAKDIANFLATKFTNAELYEWMSGVLGGVYQYFLQQATSVARMAQEQLRLERQESPNEFVQEDYWDPPNDVGTSTTVDRRGLTGSARLLEDLYRLDQFAFESNKRKLNVTQVLSLSSLFPSEFAEFRNTGLLQFSTRLAMFDRLFPGHYLRLIKRVRTSIVALIPPTDGIRATLEAGPTSYVVIGGDVFQDDPPRALTRPDVERVALTSPVNAAGVFELDAQSDMLAPFESMGVATNWALTLPKPANAFDYDSIADVLITIDYTALFSADYRSQVIQRLPRKESIDRTYSVRNDLPDVWYELTNPAESAGDDVKPVIRITSKRAHFPPNLSGVRIDQVLFVLITDGDRENGLVVDFSAPLDGGKAAVGSAKMVEGCINTRRLGTDEWSRVIKEVSGTDQAWEFRPKESAKKFASRLANGTVSDVLIILTASGVCAPWPENFIG